MSEDARALVGVVIPVRDGARFLADAIESVRAQRGQGWELVVVDDGSRDDSREVAERFTTDTRIRVLATPPRGLSAARNHGLAATTAPYVVFLDGDDRLRADALERFAAALEGSPASVLAYGEATLIDDEGRPSGGHRSPLLARRPDGNALDALLTRNFIATPGAACVRRATLVEVGAFREELVRAEDWEVWCRLALAGSFRYLGPRAVVEKRWHERSISATLGQSAEPTRAGLDEVFSHPALASLGAARLAQLRKRQEASMLAIAATDQLKQRRTRTARRYLWQSLRLDPTLRELVLLAATFVPGAPRALSPWLR